MTAGQLLSYTDNGTPGNVGPAHVVVGADGWDQFKFLFAGRNASSENRIYAVDAAGRLLAYTDNGTPGNVSQPVVVGNVGWLQFKSLFAGTTTTGKNHIYAVNDGGQLLSYTDNGTPGNVGPAHVVVGNSGWLQFKSLFAGANLTSENRIYAVNDGGQLLSYTDNGTPGNVGPAHVVVGADGWDQFKFLFAGPNEGQPFSSNAIYAVNDEGQLLSYSDDGFPGNVGHPMTVGNGAWLEFKSLFAGTNIAGGNRIYAVYVPGGSGGGGGGGGTSLLAGVAPLPQNLTNSGLRIQGNNFGANETVEIIVTWTVSGVSQPEPLTAQTNMAGYFVVWFTGITPDGLCPINVPPGQQQPQQNFSVKATGVESGKTASTTAFPFTCPS